MDHKDDIVDAMTYAAAALRDSSDAVNHPRHYADPTTGKTIECIDIIDSLVNGYTPAQAYYVGTIFKYLYRFNKKNGSEDLKKARWYLDRLIAKKEAAEKSAKEFELPEEKSDAYRDYLEIHKNHMED